MELSSNAVRFEYGVHHARRSTLAEQTTPVTLAISSRVAEIRMDLDLRVLEDCRTMMPGGTSHQRSLDWLLCWLFGVGHPLRRLAGVVLSGSVLRHPGFFFKHLFKLTKEALF